MVSSVKTTDAAVAASVTTTYTTPLRAAIVAGATITATDLNLLNSFIVAVTPHTHTFVDVVVLKTFGNTGATSQAADVTGAYTTYGSQTHTAGATIAVAQYNAMANGANAFISHTHPWTDN